MTPCPECHAAPCKSGCVNEPEPVECPECYEGRIFHRDGTVEQHERCNGTGTLTPEQVREDERRERDL